MLTKEECLEALNYLASGQCSYCWKTHGKETDVECQESKQMLEQLIDEHFELVEKATPKKPIYKAFDDNGFGKIIPTEAYCPICGYEFEFGSWNERANHHCECGQAIDWSKEDEK